MLRGVLNYFASEKWHDFWVDCLILLMMVAGIKKDDLTAICIAFAGKIIIDELRKTRNAARVGDDTNGARYRTGHVEDRTARHNGTGQ